MQPRVFHLTYLLFPTLSQNPTLLNEKIQFNLNLKILFSKAHLLLAKNNFIIQHCWSVTLFECLSLSCKAFFLLYVMQMKKSYREMYSKQYFFRKKKFALGARKIGQNVKKWGLSKKETCLRGLEAARPLGRNYWTFKYTYL